MDGLFQTSCDKIGHVLAHSNKILYWGFAHWGWLPVITPTLVGSGSTPLTVSLFPMKVTEGTI